MKTELSFFNWSLKKLIATETGSFNIARLRIIHALLILSLVKGIIVLVIAGYHHQQFQQVRAGIVMAIYLLLLKLILVDKRYVKAITHAMLTVGIFIILSVLIVSPKTVNIVALQFVFMATLSGFYLLNRFWGLFYSIVGCLPVVLFVLIPPNKAALHDVIPEALASPGMQIIIILNFITIIIAHYLYHQAFSMSIKEKESLNIQLEEAVEKANKLAQSRSDFLSTMSHELRTPLNAVIGITDLLLDEPHDKKQNENLEILKFSAVSLHALINDILDFNKLGSEKLHLEAVSVPITELMRKICSGLEVQAKDKGLYLKLSIDDSLDKRPVITDPVRVTQIVYNLVGNAIKFTKHGGVIVTLKLIEQDENHVKIGFSVSDTGIGISADKQQVIFEPFVQASANTTRNFGGTGLGLFIVKRLLILFGSDIQLKSTLGEGSEFFFEITFKAENAPREQNFANQNATDELSGLNVLIAEDNSMNRLVVQKLCTRWHIKTEMATNGAEAVAKMQAGHYDIVLMDIHMPDMDGYEATKQIRMMPDRTKATTPIIALTASVAYDLPQKVKEAGMNDYVLKPLNASELYNKLKIIAANLH